MDPDLVRQQEEAEREALALMRAKAQGAAPAEAESLARATVPAAFQQTPAASPWLTAKPLAPLPEAATIEPAPRFEAATAPASPLMAEPAPALEAQPQRERKGSIAGRFGRFISFGVAGAMLGGALGMAAANYFQLPADLAKLAIFGSAGFFLAVCAFASFFAKTPKSYS